MATSSFPTVTTGVTVETATSGALSGDGSSGNKLAVGVDGVTIDVNGSNQLEALGAAVAFKTIAVSGQSSIVADAADDTLTIVAGSNITLTTNAGTDTLTIAASGGTPASPSGSLQFNNSGAFGGFGSYDGTTLVLPNVYGASPSSVFVIPEQVTNASATAAANQALAAGTYYLVVTAFDVAGNESALSSELTVTIPIEDDGSGSAEVTGDTVLSATKYRVYWGTAPGSEDTFQDFTSAPPWSAGNADDMGAPPSVPTFNVYEISSRTLLWTAINETSPSKAGISNFIFGSGITQTLTPNGSSTAQFNVGFGPLNQATLTSGSWNTSAGGRALPAVTTGSFNTAVGGDALYSGTTGDNNTGFGADAGYNNVTGSNNTSLGSQAGSDDTRDNTLALGYGANVTASNRAVLGDSNLTDVFCGSETAAANIRALSVVPTATAYASLPTPVASSYPIAVVNNSIVTSGAVSAGGGAHVNVIVWDGTNWQVLKNLT